MDAHFELLAAFFIDVRAFDDCERAFAGRQRDRAGNLSAGSQGGIDNLLSRLVDDLVVIGLKADADALLYFWFFSFGHILLF